MNIVITSGEPAGIGPDIIIKLFKNPQLAKILKQTKLTIFGNKLLFDERGQSININFTEQLIKFPQIKFIDFPFLPKTKVGKPEPKSANYVLSMINSAITGCQSNEYNAMVTAPIQKSNIIAGGFKNFRGHTEFLAEKTNSPHPVMMLSSPKLKVVPLTVHIPLKDVCKNINRLLIINTVEVLIKELKFKYNLPKATIAVLGINPHGGETGKIGDEEVKILIPTIKALQKKHPQVNFIFPLSPDTAFLENIRAKVDVYLGMYHDQVLPVFKTLAFGGGVNVTLGLPIIRTSVDHGTALDIAGTGKACESGLISAIIEAIELSKITKVYKTL